MRWEAVARGQPTRMPLTDARERSQEVNARVHGGGEVRLADPLRVPAGPSGSGGWGHLSPCSPNRASQSIHSPTDLGASFPCNLLPIAIWTDRPRSKGRRPEGNEETHKRTNAQRQR